MGTMSRRRADSARKAKMQAAVQQPAVQPETAAKKDSKPKKAK